MLRFGQVHATAQLFHFSVIFSLCVQLLHSSVTSTELRGLRHDVDVRPSHLVHSVENSSNFFFGGVRRDQRAAQG